MGFPTIELSGGFVPFTTHLLQLLLASNYVHTHIVYYSANSFENMSLNDTFKIMSQRKNIKKSVLRK